jgi:uncharacterized SAM-binding protein YcdF (DUF218 family)
MSNGDVPTGEVPVTYATEVLGAHEYEAGVVDRRKRRTPLGIAVRVAAVLATVVLTYYVVTLYQVWSTGRRDQARPVDAIVVLGAAQYDGRPSPQLAARLDHVVALWPRGLAPIVIVTGGKQPADRFTEAEASARYLVERGVPESALVFENAGRSTYESLEGVADLLHARGLRTVLLVTDPFHALRSRLTAEELGLEAYVSPTETSVVTGASSFGKHLQEAAGISFGRIMGFDRLRGLTG